MTLPNRNWLDMTWQDVAGADTGRWIAVLPLAAVEQHGPHLPLGVDTYIAEAYLERAQKLLHEDLPVTFLPICVTASSSSACRRPVMKTWAPSATNRRAVARPMSLLPPVTTATLPSSFFDMGLLRRL